MDLRKIQPNSKRVRNKKRVGRGVGSGLGKTCGRGHKGLKSRSGGKVRRGFEGGQMPLQKRIPKYGFSSRANQFSEEVRLSEIINLGKKNIDIAILHKSKLIKKRTNKVKVILDESPEKTINLSGIATSSSVKKLIEKAGGTVK
tara:strand:+ start:270 stop:701 length:432 start_codon:yes stop_codon:yes gene_type:complete